MYIFLILIYYIPYVSFYAVKLWLKIEVTSTNRSQNFNIFVFYRPVSKTHNKIKKSTNISGSLNAIDFTFWQKLHHEERKTFSTKSKLLLNFIWSKFATIFLILQLVISYYCWRQHCYDLHFSFMEMNTAFGFGYVLIEKTILLFCH